MIGPVLDAVRPRVGFADALIQSDETLTAVAGDSGEAVSRRAGRWVYLRVEDQGRLGLAVRDDGLIPPLVESALQTARYGPPSSLLAPAPSPLPGVITAYPAVAALGSQELLNFARLLRDRLLADGREVETWAECSTGRVDLGNTSGVMAGYDASLAGVGLRVRAATGAGPLLLRLHDSALTPPAETMLEELVAEVEQRLAPPLLDQPAPDGAVALWLAPRALAALLVPLCQALLAQQVWSDEGPFAGMVGERVLSPRITLRDDPLAPGRPGTRPVDDEGVVCRRITLVEQGVLRGGLADLSTAARLGVPATGHGCRSPAGPPTTGWSNLVLEPDPAAGNGATPMDDGILVRDLPFPGAQCVNGRVSLATPWAYRVTGGEITGRYERLVLQGNVFEWLNRVRWIGANARWIGARLLPEMVID